MRFTDGIVREEAGDEVMISVGNWEAILAVSGRQSVECEFVPHRLIVLGETNFAEKRFR